MECFDLLLSRNNYLQTLLIHNFFIQYTLCRLNEFVDIIQLILYIKFCDFWTLVASFYMLAVLSFPSDLVLVFCASNVLFSSDIAFSSVLKLVAEVKLLCEHLRSSFHWL